MNIIQMHNLVAQKLPCHKLIRKKKFLQKLNMWSLYKIVCSLPMSHHVCIVERCYLQP
jgi:hypothetical protein